MTKIWSSIGIDNSKGNAISHKPLEKFHPHPPRLFTFPVSNFFGIDYYIPKISTLAGNLHYFCANTSLSVLTFSILKSLHSGILQHNFPTVSQHLSSIQQGMICSPSSSCYIIWMYLFIFIHNFFLELGLTCTSKSTISLIDKKKMERLAILIIYLIIYQMNVKFCGLACCNMSHKCIIPCLRFAVILLCLLVSTLHWSGYLVFLGWFWYNSLIWTNELQNWYNCWL